MKNNFKFKLDGLLTMRKNEEYKILLKLGKINTRINTIDSTIRRIKKNIGTSFDSYEKYAKETSSEVAKFFPYYNSGLYTHINELLIEKKQQESKHKKIMKEYNQIRAKVKLLENMREKKYNEYIKNLKKKESMMLEEIAITNKIFMEEK